MNLNWNSVNTELVDANLNSAFLFHQLLESDWLSPTPCLYLSLFFIIIQMSFVGKAFGSWSLLPRSKPTDKREELDNLNGTSPNCRKSSETTGTQSFGRTGAHKERDTISLSPIKEIFKMKHSYRRRNLLTTSFVEWMYRSPRSNVSIQDILVVQRQ